MTTPAATPPPFPRRFRWPMRLFLTFFLASLTYRCFAVLWPLGAWSKHYGVRKYPARLSTLTELAAASNRATDDNPHPVLEDCFRTADAVWDYGKPWPTAKSRARIASWNDGVKVTACWLNGHLAFVEHVCGIDEGWQMFSPSVYAHDYHTRARLIYEDDSELVVRQNAEPADYRHYAHWSKKKIMTYETRVEDDDEDLCAGYCNLLLHRYGQNASGSSLTKIVLFQVRVEFPPPGGDALAHYAEQNRLTATPPRLPGTFRSDLTRASPQVRPDFYEFDVAERQGKLLKDER